MTRTFLPTARLLPLWLALLGALCMAPTQAAEADDAEALLRNGRHAQALAQADAFLQTRPRDAQMRFVKARAQSALGRRAEAAATLRDLTQDYPTLPEPLNNLAALQAADGQWDAALRSLEATLRLKPDYALAYENLGDVYLALAQRAYARTLALDPGNGALRTRAGLLKPAPALGTAAGAAGAKKPAPAAASASGVAPLPATTAATAPPVPEAAENVPEDSAASAAETMPVSPTPVFAPASLPALPAAATTPTR